VSIRHYFLLSLFFLSVSFVLPSHAFAQERDYYVYVEPVPDYAATYASNSIHDATSAWTTANPDIKFYKASDADHADLNVQWVRDFGSVNGRIGQEISGHLINVGLGDSNCGGSWQPYSALTVTQIAEHEIGHFLGLPHSSNPNDVMFPTTNVQYGTVTWQKDLDTGYVWFVPVCTTKSVSSFAYSVSLSSQNEAFDVYFVPSIDELSKYTNNQQFQYYTDKGCYGTNWVTYNGFCNGVSQTSGLLIATHSHLLINHLITITAQFTEQTVSSINPAIPAVSGGSQPSAQSSNTQSPTTNDSGFVWIGILIVVIIICGGIGAMVYAMKPRYRAKNM